MNGCISTHGGAGYAPGSYRKGSKIVCGLCGEEIENPPVIRYRRTRRPGRKGEGIWARLFGVRERVPDYGEAVK